MNGAGAGALVGLTAGLGILLVVVRLPVMRRIRMVDRIAPYVGSVSAWPLRASAPPRSRSLLALTAGRLDRLVGGRAALETRLTAAGNRMTVEQYRIAQVLWASTGVVPGLAVLTLGGLSSRPSLSLAGVALVVAGAVGGVLARDSSLSRDITIRNAVILSELPAVADLLSLAVAAGEGALGALQRVARSGGGPLRQELKRVLEDVRSGEPLVSALDALGARTPVSALVRFLDGLVVAIERGTPLADLLRAQASDVREAAKRELMESGGRKEIAMMVPVVFLILPTVVLFAAYPAFTSLTFVTP